MAKKKAKAKKKVRKKTPAREPAKKKTAKKAKRKAAKKKPKNLATRAKNALKKNPKSQKKIARKLTPKQILFVDCYLGAAKRTATAAALLAGYSEKSVNSEAAQLMANPKVRSYLKRRQDDLRRRLEVTQEKVAREMAVLAFSKPTDYLKWRNGKLILTDSDELPDCLVGAIKGLKPLFDKDGRSLGIEVKFYDKVAAAKLLAQHLGMLDFHARDGSKGTIVEAMEKLHAEAEKLDKEKAG